MKLIHINIITIICMVLLLLLPFINRSIEYTDVKVGAERTEIFIPMLKNKNVGIVANQTSLINTTHLVDSLVSLKVKVIRICSPEHGFRGDADAGEHVSNYTDLKTGVPVISLYGNNKKPKVNDLDEIDIIIFDIQDVGVRFYTYISTLHYIMEACAENEIELIVLDRPNPNGFYIDGPVLDMQYKSFVGMHAVPIVHGMTIGEYAQMINGEGWLGNKAKCKLKIITCINYSHKVYYKLPVKPSPNLPDMESVYLYPTIGLLEGTIMSVGRGTDFPFQVYGEPEFSDTSFSFIPASISGAAKNPKYRGITCYGKDLRNMGSEIIVPEKKIHLEWLRVAYLGSSVQNKFFDSFFNNLAGNSKLKQQIIAGTDIETVRSEWQEGIYKFKVTRKKYLLYEDFE
ncbi:MAG: DUF1343 domain-containing protein [Bacteroidia bacterium]|nr:DUF1343 domain-containing protein [Bacteroidia bacterium]